MPYVMVPVPAEHEQELTMLVLQMSFRSALSTWDQESISVTYQEADGQQRDLMVRLSEASSGAREITDVELAEAMGLTREQVHEVVEGLNVSCHSRSQPSLVLTDPRSETSGDGSMREWALLIIARPYAVMVLDANNTATSG